LTQDGASRIITAVQAQNFEASFESEIIDAELEIDGVIPDCLTPTLIPPDIVPTCGHIFLDFAEVGFDFDANPGLNGFVNIYKGIGNPKPLNPAGPDANLTCTLSGGGCWGSGDCAGNGQSCVDGACAVTGDSCSMNEECADSCVGGEFVPRFTFATKNLDHFDAEASISQCLTLFLFTPAPVPVACAPHPLAIGLDLDLGLEAFDNFTFDYWDLGEDPGVITDDEDYIDGDPWHIVSPPLHGFGSHVDPLD
jgi:hypothetical protein